jgi:hypothetical protein
MSDRAWAATRKGLFELRRVGALWRVERVSFLGEPVTMLLAPAGRGPHAGGAEPGPLRRQAARLGRRRGAPGARWRCRPTRRTRWGDRAGVEAGAGLVAGRGRSGPRLGRHLARRPVLVRRLRQPAGAVRGAVAAARPQRVVRRRLRRAGHPLAVPAPAASRRRCCWASAAAAPGRPPTTAASWQQRSRGMRADLHAARARRRPRTCRTRT